MPLMQPVNRGVRTSSFDPTVMEYNMQAESDINHLLQDNVASTSASTTPIRPSSSTGNSSINNPPPPSTPLQIPNTTTRMQDPTIQKRQGFLRCILELPAGHTFLHSVGLKSFSTKTRYQTPEKQEKQKAVLNTSRYIALTRLAVHLLPSAITIFLLGFNTMVMINGPEISTQGQFMLQGAAKLHELTIIGSLAAVILDVIRYQMTHNGIELGLLNSAFSFFGLNFLWSQEFFSAFQNALRKYRKIPVLLFLVLCCLLAALVGPASALLFLPNSAWLSTGSTELYLIGSEDQLWPQRLTINHTGPHWCDLGGSGEHYCLQGGWEIVRGFNTPEGVSRRSVNMVDASTHRTMWTWRPFHGDTDSWASTVHAASAYIATFLEWDHDKAWNFAKGRQRRLRDAVTAGMYARLIGRIPVVRVLCTPCKMLQHEPFKLQFPVLNESESWRFGSVPGPVRELQLDPKPTSRINTAWISLPSDFGSTTAGLSFVTRNDTGPVIGCGCAVDARWAQGQSTLFGDSIRWEAAISPPSIPESINAPDTARVSFSDTIEEGCGPTISADLEWLERLSTTFFLGDTRLNATPVRTNFTSLEAVLLETRLWDVSWLISDPEGSIQELEAVLSLYFVNALSRIGWDAQLEGGTNEINPLLRNGSSDNDRLLHNNGQIYQRIPADIAPTTALKQEWFNYTTAWQLNEPALYVSVAILAVHLVIVLMHSIYVLWTKESSEAWNSIPELIALAYNSKPTDGALKNCGAGIMLMKTLGQEVKVIATLDGAEDGSQKVQLVLCKERSIHGLLSHEKGMAVRADIEYA